MALTLLHFRLDQLVWTVDLNIDGSLRCDMQKLSTMRFLCASWHYHRKIGLRSGWVPVAFTA